MEMTYTNPIPNMNVQRILIIFLEEQNNDSRSQKQFLLPLEAREPLVSLATITGFGTVHTFE
jgi:hypothetical protein